MNYQPINASATIKMAPADFIVNEILDFDLSGDGEHLWCYVEKTNMNTSYLERQWVKLIGCQRRDISHSGLKDRHAVTRQWLCLPAIYGDKLPDSGDGWRIIERKRHLKKLRIGTHKYNAFELTLRNINGERASIEQALYDLQSHGFLNTFGEQRFGHRNLAQAERWVERKQLPKKRDERAQVLSTLRAFLFNAQVQLRAKLGLVNTLVVGDRAMLTGSHSHFVVDTIDDELNQRLQAGDVTPGGWLVGKNKAPFEDDDSQQLRTQALAPYPQMVEYLLAHCTSDWRAMTIRARDLSWTWQSDNVLTLQCKLPKGGFATSMLAQLFDIKDASAID